MKYNILSLLVRLIRPGHRGDVYRELENMFSEVWVAKLKNELDKPQYAYRTVGLRAANAKVILDDFVHNHTFNPMNPKRILEQIKKHINCCATPFNYDQLRNMNILDYGSGIFNPLAKSFLMYINGAKAAVAYEPFSIRHDIATISIKELIFEVLRNPIFFNFSGIKESDMRIRIANLNIDKILNNSKPKIESGLSFFNDDIHKLLPKATNFFDLILSTSVLEHVKDLKEELKIMHHITSNKVILIHDIDFADHRFALENYHPLRFMQDGHLGSINGLRLSEVIELMGKNDFKLNIAENKKIDIDKFFSDTLLEKYKVYSKDDLSTVLCRLVATKK